MGNCVPKKETEGLETHNEDNKDTAPKAQATTQPQAQPQPAVAASPAGGESKSTQEDEDTMGQNASLSRNPGLKFTVDQQLKKPTDASDIKNLEEARKELSLMRFRVWDAMQASMSGPDKKDSSDFKYVSYSEFPPFTPYHRSLMAKTLQQDRSLWDKLKDRKTSKGYTFSNAIQTGVQTPHLGVGITAGDEESWEVFKEIMYPVIRGWHNFDPETQFHKSDLNPENLKFTEEQVKLFNEYVVSTRIRAARNVSGYSLPAGATDEERTGVEKVLRQAFSGLSGELKGKYYPLYEMSATDEAFLRDNGFLFQKPAVTNLLTNAGAARNWPQGRGIFHNDTRTALCWCNEEDHCRIISMEEGGNVKSVFARFSQLSDALKSSAEANGTKLMFSDRLGFLGTCPSNLGTGLRASVMIRLPEFNKDPALLEAVCDKFDLQPRGSAGEHSAAVGAKWDVSNKQRIGFTEVELVQKMIDGVTKIIALEQKLAAGESIKEGVDF